jgi:DNA mismatch repair ATPase MutS
MDREHDFYQDLKLPPNSQALTQDLGLDTLFNAMAHGDKFLFEVAQKGVLASLLEEPEQIVYRQDVLKDCIEHPAIVKHMYDIAVSAIEAERKVWHVFLDYPEAILRWKLEVMQLSVRELKKLRAVADQHSAEFRSEGFAALFATLKKELDDDYLRRMDEHLKQLKFDRGLVTSAELGKGNKGKNYVLRKPRYLRPAWQEWFSFLDRSGLTFEVAPRDEAGMHALSEMRDRGVNLAADALAQSADHILSFFNMLRAELGFYLGCLNLRRLLMEKGEPVCFPVPVSIDRREFSCRGLYDLCLSLRQRERVVGNEVNAPGKLLTLVTGANQGGKSTFMRSVGLAQLMMQSGMFVAAESFESNCSESVYTHYRREEDVTMTSGKLDEELRRMSDIADQLTPNSLMLFNESFSATNEREGAEIAGSIVRALVETGIKVFFVTHTFELAHRFHKEGRGDALFLRAERLPDGTRTFKVLEGEPLSTSFGQDLYGQIFHEDPAEASAFTR